jgi:hypothetical protein
MGSQSTNEEKRRVSESRIVSKRGGNIPAIDVAVAIVIASHCVAIAITSPLSSHRRRHHVTSPSHRIAIISYRHHIASPSHRITIAHLGQDIRHTIIGKRGVIEHEIEVQ